MARCTSNADIRRGQVVVIFIIAAIGLILYSVIANSTPVETVTKAPSGEVSITRTSHIGIGPVAESYVETVTVISLPYAEED